MAARRPNLFIVGAPRCGTSSLHVYLSTHPDIFMSEMKEPHYHSTDLTEECDIRQGGMVYGPFRSEAQYLWLFAKAGDQRVIGEASPLYLYSKAAAESIHGFDPDARIIIMLREPVGFMYSLHSLYRYHLDEDRASFADALDAEASRKLGRDVPSGVRIPSLLWYREMARFSVQVQRYYEMFPPENIKVVIMDDLRKDTRAVYQDVLQFLGVESVDAVPQTLRRMNPNPEPRSKLVSRFLRRRSPAVCQLYGDPSFPVPPRVDLAPSLLPVDLRVKLLKLLVRVNTRRKPRPELQDSTRQQLMGELRDEVQKLSQLLNRDLAELWGYTHP